MGSHNAPNVSLSGDLKVQPGAVHVVGQHIQVYDRLSDGSLVLRREKFVPNPQRITSLLDIWSIGHKEKYDLFLDEAVRNGIVNEHTMEWLHGSVSLICCYQFLSANGVGVVKSNLEWTDVYKAFSGTFRLVKIKNARNIQVNPSKKTHAYRKKEKEWKNFFIERFSLGQ